jgi:hypothetical protein
MHAAVLIDQYRRVQFAAYSAGIPAKWRSSGGLELIPVFFGRTMVGRNLPSLTYMLTFDDLASRERS